MNAWYAVLVDRRLDGESLCETKAEANAYFKQWYPNPDESKAVQCIVDVRVVSIRRRKSLCDKLKKKQGFLE